MTDPTPDGRTLTLTARLTTARLDSRRGVVRVHREVLAALGLSAWDAVRLTGARTTGAVAAVSSGARGDLLCDDLLLGNLGVRDGDPVTVSPAPLVEARRVVVAGSAESMTAIRPTMLRDSLLGKVVTAGDNVSLLPQDAAPGALREAASTRRSLSTAMGMAWTTTLLTVTGTEPAGPALVTMGTTVGWRDGASTTGSATPMLATGGASGPADEPVPAIEDLPGLQNQAAQLREWLDLGFHHKDVLARLGTTPQLGVLVTGPAGSGKTTLVRSVAAAVGARVVRRWAPGIAALEASAAAAALREAVTEAAGTTPAVLLIEDVEALAPRDDAKPVATVLLDVVGRAVATAGLAVVCTSARPEGVSPELRRPGRLDHELSVPLPDRAGRRALLDVVFRSAPLAGDVHLDEIAERTPGFVVADLLALRREAAGRAAGRQRDVANPMVFHADLLGALEVVRPTAMAESTLDIPDLTLDDVGDMVEVKQALTETVLWPLSYPDTFARLGVQPARGLLLYGPPGCGKTFLVRAIAGSGQANVLSVKGAELLSKWVGESERAVRELFRRAREAAPSLVFLDEVDALAPVRGQSTDSGVADRVVAALLTELDGIEGLRDVVVIGATNRPDLVDPALLRPGRMGRLVFVPPPDAEARAAILRAASKRTPLGEGVDLDAVAADTEGYSGADLAALVRESALAAMRRSFDAPEVTAEDVAAARRSVRPSLRAEQVATLAAFAARHQPG
ncbi:MAG: Cell division protein FtsH [uncultured Corynebacteriales bacterium]|uniref:Cell division protein FtsH n=1 Tax=uncultured Mycobacteriales bacterium TaxID=581187 RepID=A0A6J4K0Z3_9ACTN|nr:MAG: Cell division protein FtsH [uncultured Corynebacteriales bacterium]